MAAFVDRFMALSAGYGFVRGVVRTHNARVSEYDEDYKKSWRPMMVTERVATVCVSAVVGIVGAPLMAAADVYHLERHARGYKPKKEPESMLDFVYT